MSALVIKTLSAGVAISALALVLMSSVSASDDSEIRAQCQRQVEEYGIEPEQRDEYLSGCILSMGGDINADQNLETGSEDTAEAEVSPEAEASDIAQ
jgi:hypothetical protein